MSKHMTQHKSPTDGDETPKTELLSVVPEKEPGHDDDGERPVPLYLGEHEATRDDDAATSETEKPEGALGLSEARRCLGP